MRHLCGFFSSVPLAQPAQHLLARQRAACGIAADSRDLVREGRMALAADWVAQAPGGAVAGVSGRPWWDDPRLARTAADRGHAEALLESYLERGLSCLEPLRGQFSCALRDPGAGRSLLALDRIGQCHLYHAAPSGALVFGSDARAVAGFPGVSRELSHQGIFNYLYFHMVPSPGTVYRDVSKLVGAHYLLQEAGANRTVRYWTPSFDETGGASIRELGGELKARVRAQVERLADRPAAGAFLSGGLDSSTVAGMLAAARPGAARTYSIGFPAEGYDELRYARIAATHFGTIQREYQVTPEDAVAAIAQVAAGCDEPFGNSSALAVYFCARLARQDGIELLLGGDGGDEIFAGNTRYAKQGIFEAYARVPSALRHHLIQPLLAVPGMDRLPLVRKAHSYVRQARVPLPDRLDSYNFLHRHAADEIFDPDFLRTVDVDQPLREVRETYRTPEHASPLNRMLYLDWKRTLQDNDLVKVNRMCQLAGVDVAYPMLDDAVVELSCRVPSRLKLRPGRIRHFYKEAMRDFLPPEIIRKRKHGFGLPFGVWTRSHPQLQELAYGSVAALEHHGFFRPDFLHRAVALHRSDTPEYYGELVWILMMLRLWLDGGSGGPARPGG